MRIILRENQLDNLAFRFVLDKLNDMDFRFKKYKEFDFFPKGSPRAELGIEADWVKGKGYDILIGNTLWRSVQDMFNLTDDQVQSLFIRAFIEKGIKKINRVTTLDFSPFMDILTGNVNEEINKESKIDKLIKSYLDSQNWKDWDIGDGEFNVADGEFGKDLIRYRIQYSSTVPDRYYNVIYISDYLVEKINALFGLNNLKSIKSIINWFNQKYDKNLTMEDFEWMDYDDSYDVDDEINENLTKKKLVEGMQISDDAPDWVKVFHTLPKNEKIEHIEKYKKHIQKLLPKIVEFFKTKFGDDLVHLIAKTKNVHYGNENYSTDKILLDFRFSDKTPNVTQLKREVFNDLNSFFNIDITYYGTPLDLDFHKAVWEKF